MSTQPRLLFVSHRVPYPPDKGERVRAFHEIRALAGEFRLTLATLCHGPRDGESVQALGQWCERVFQARAGGWQGLARGGVSLLAGRSVTEGYFASRALQAWIEAEHHRDPFAVAMGYSSSTFRYIQAVPAGRRVMDLIDVDSAKWAQYAQQGPWPRRWLYAREARGVADLEARALAGSQAVLLVSQAEADLLGDAGGHVRAVSNGVDLEFFAPRPDKQEEPLLVFTGTMDYAPNVEGVGWFVREVWPGLRRQVPELRLAVVGRNPAPAVRRLANEPGVEVTGAVPDVRPYLARAALAVCPLRIARGIQNKVLEAMAMAKAVVASPAAVEGLDVQTGREVLAADAPAQWQARIVQLINDPPARQAMGQAARQCVERHYSWSARLEPLVALCRVLANQGADAMDRVQA